MLPHRVPSAVTHPTPISPVVHGPRHRLSKGLAATRRHEEARVAGSDDLRYSPDA